MTKEGTDEQAVWSAREKALAKKQAAEDKAELEKEGLSTNQFEGPPIISTDKHHRARKVPPSGS